MKNSRNIFLISTLILIIACSTAFSFHSVSIFKDQGGHYKVHDLPKNLFVPIKPDELNLGYTKDIIWIKISLDSSFNSERQYLHFPKSIHDSLSLFHKEEGEWISLHTGISTKDSAYAFYSGYYIPTNHFKNAKNIYVRSKSVYAQDLNFQLVEKSSFNRNENQYTVIFGVLIGSILIIILYNLFLGLSIKDVTYFFYVLTGLSSLASQLTLLGVFNNTEMIEFIQFKKIMIPICITSINVFGSIFCIKFLELRKYHKTAKNILFAVVIFNLIQLVTCLILNLNDIFTPYRFAAIGGLLFVISAMFAGFVAMKQGNENAKYYLIAWGLFLISIVILALKVLGVIPSNLLTNNFFWMASIIEMLLLSLALAARYKLWQQDKNEAQKKIEFQQMDLDRIATDNSKRIKFKNGLINDLKKIISDEKNPKVALKSLILDYDLQLTTEKKQDHLNSNMSVVDAEFKDNLITTYPKLTESEVEICGYVLMGLTNNEIAVFRSSNSVAIKSARYRIRKKMELEKNQNIADALKSLKKKDF